MFTRSAVRRKAHGSICLSYYETRNPGLGAFYEKEPRGIAYETDTHFVHFFGKDRGVWVVSTGLTVTQARDGTLHDWIEQTFGAVGVEKVNCGVGHTIHGVWRPGLFYSEEVLQGVSATTFELRLAEQALLLLIERLNELLHFIEPSSDTLRAHGHKARELLILACTEVETAWKAYMRIAGTPPGGRAEFTTNDYVKLLEPLHLAEYEVSLPRYAAIPPIPAIPRVVSDTADRSLPWYEAYNKTKHDRNLHFSEATLWNCLQAVAANIALFSSRFVRFTFSTELAPSRLILISSSLLSCGTAHLLRSIRRNCASLPIKRNDLICFGSQELVEPRIVDPLRI